jgi:hypothetical protein
VIPVQRRLVHAMLAAQAGLLPEAQEQLDAAYAAAGGSAFTKTLELVGQRLGLALPRG